MYEARKSDGQMGGLPALQSIMATQVLRMHGRIAQHRKLTSAVIFLDVKSAFHNMLREWVLLVQSPLDRSDVEHILNSRDIDVEPILARMNEAVKARPSDFPPGLRWYIHSLHMHTWFQLQGMDLDSQQSPAVTKTTRGSRPGSPVADIAFNLHMAGLIRRIESRLADIPLYCQGHALIQERIPVLAWVDDIAIATTTAAPQDMLPLLQHIMEVVHDAFTQEGLNLSYLQGKSECVLTYRGPGAEKARLSLYDRDETPQLVFATQDHIVSMRIVTAYKHWGVKFSMAADLQSELTARLHQGRTAFMDLRRPIFSNQHIPAETRMQLLHSLVFTRTLYGATTWTDLSPSMISQLDAQLARYQRHVHRAFYTPDGVNLPTRTFRAKHRLPSFLDRKSVV